MPTTTTRRPLPALAFLLALSVLTAIVWWRVLHRDTEAATPKAATPTPTASCATPGHKVTLPSASSVTVRVLNGNGQAGLASSVNTQLENRGFKSAGFADAPALLPTAGELHYGAAGRSGANLLSYYLPGLKLIPISRADATVDVVLGKTFHALSTPSAVSAAITKATKTC